MQCELRRCGGSGQREVKRPWRARVCVTVKGMPYHVCEHCADLLINEARERGLRYKRHYAEHYEEEPLPPSPPWEKAWLRGQKKKRRRSKSKKTSGGRHRVPRAVTGQPHGELTIARGNPHFVVHVQSRVRPGEHAVAPRPSPLAPSPHPR